MTATKRFSFLTHMFVTMTVLIIGAMVLSSLSSGALVNLVSSDCAAGTYQQAGQCVAPVTPTQEQQDVAAEGQDVLTLGYDDTPADLWNALRAQGYVGVQGDGCECLYVPVGTVVDVPGGLYLATIDGLMVCGDTWFDQECSATGPVVPVDVLTSVSTGATSNVQDL